jgi:hypothetical protein
LNVLAKTLLPEITAEEMNAPPSMPVTAVQPVRSWLIATV